jgi:hypothetical protein
MLKPFNMVQLKRVTEISQHKGQWIALLISMHMSFLYEEKRGESKDIDEFLDLQKSNQQKWRRQLKITVKEASQAYAIMQWCDRFSLILCRNELPAGERTLEVTKGPDGKRYEVIQKATEIVTVDPWPFHEDSFSLSIEASRISQLSFDNDRQLLDTLRQSPVIEKKWLLKKNA